MPNPPTSPIELILPDLRALPELAERLRGELALDEGRDANLRVGFLDSADWRLYTAGLILVEERTDQQRHLTLLDRSGATRPLVMRVIGDDEIGLATLADGPIRRRLQPLLAPRALLPQVRLEVSQRSYDLRGGEEEKIRVRGRLLKPAVVAPLGGTESLPPRLEFTLVKGYEAEFEALSHRLADLAPRPPALLEEALAALGRTPDDYRPIPRLDSAEGSAGAVVPRLLEHWLNLIERSLPGVKGRLDPLFPEELLTAVERSLFLMKALAPRWPAVAPPEVATAFAAVAEAGRPLLHELGVMTKLRGLADALPADQTEGGAGLVALLAPAEERHYAGLIRQLNSAGFRKALKGWRDALKRIDPAALPEPAAALFGPLLGGLWAEAAGGIGAAKPDARRANAGSHGANPTTALSQFLEALAPLLPESAPLRQPLAALARSSAEAETAAQAAQRVRELLKEQAAVPTQVTLAAGMVLQRLAEDQAAGEAAAAQLTVELNGEACSRAARQLFDKAG